ncbi:hypothetical protein ASPWEDRAFT_39562 [Aspergillus wentii DTO 134E9]|uniref:Homeobox domain-containing protein n=1 Tax=Aspergillus wentii DTO 134E9 TaxID=1073089 RepID=A0A1L9RSA0_ASPWE|nr:uncharacterized protein ASPWEDRAFT_39562 [Aspergillus wentii DTO 134E9]KAI9930658.1 hypothetical protein MW887_011413 [Aspergillus wentii]OJJ37821.1 hypothetical protein ASPWEDRAFT_39562 [Aspergillus wentii DTO 134E9]
MEIPKFCDDILSLPPLDTTSPDPLLSHLLDQQDGLHTSESSAISRHDNQDKSTRPKNRRLSQDTVKVLRSWLHQHQEYPYPTEEEKEELQEQTGLSKTQIYNWFSNARRRRLRKRTSKRHEDPQAGSIVSPLERWKNSPPETEAAAPWEIMRALADAPYTSEGSAGYHSHSATDDAWSSNSSSASFIHGAPSSTSSIEHSQSSNSDVSFDRPRGPYQRPPTPIPSARPSRRRRRKPPRPIGQLSGSKSRGQRAFQCTFCSDTFRTKYDWQRHEKALHLLVEWWTCHYQDGPDSVCLQKFSRKDHLRQHLKLVHRVNYHHSMDDWQDSTTCLKSRCGFCNLNLSTWEERIEHVAEHFKNGADMANWKGGWGFEPEIEQLVENAMPPYLVGLERHTMDPWKSSEVLNLQTQSGIPNAFSRYTDLHRELVAYIKTSMANGIYPTDQMLRDQARMISYGYNDPWDATYADWDPMWLGSVKEEAGLTAPVHEPDIPGNLPDEAIPNIPEADFPEVDLFDDYFNFSPPGVSHLG